MFKVGDIITGVSKEYYGITTDDARMRVVEKFESNILVGLLSHKDEKYQKNIGTQYFVNPLCFVLVRPKFKGNS